MAIITRLPALFLLGVFGAHANAQDTLVERIDCTRCAEWNKPQKPFKVTENTYYVGTAELSSVLVTGPQGHILIDGALPQSAPQIEANIAALGFRLQDIKYILNSHAHFDHAGGIAQLARDSGATVVASHAAAQVLRRGVIGTDDPQWEASGNTRMSRIARIREIADGETVQVGPLQVTAQLTPGHTPGGASYAWQSCAQGRCLDVVYVDSLNPASRDGFHYSGDANTPDRSASFYASIDKIAALRCDVVLSAHPDFTDTLEKLAARTAERDPFIDAGGCKAYAADARARLDKRLAGEREQKTAAPR